MIPRSANKPIYRGLQVVSRILSTVLLDLKVFGIEHVPPTGGVLLVANHQSYLDPVCLGAQLKRPLSFLAKAQLFESHGFSWLIRELGAFPLHQGTGDLGAIRETIRRLQEGHALTVFPEGSRTLDGQMLPLQPGIVLLVRKSQVPIVPVAIHGAFKAWPSGSVMFRPAPVRVKFGPPLTVKGLRSHEIVNLVDQTLHNLLAELRAYRSNRGTDLCPTQRSRN